MKDIGYYFSNSDPKWKNKNSIYFLKFAKEQLKKIAEIKMNDLNAYDIEEAIKIIAGSARSMGIQVRD